MMQRTLLGLMLLVGLTLSGACGGDSKDSSPSTGGTPDMALTGGTTVTGGTVATGGTVGTTGGTAAPVVCGSVTCDEIAPGTPACCDAASMKCGVMAAGLGCLVASDADERCPSAGFDDIVPPCCDEAANLCGVDVLGTCTDLATASTFAAGIGVTLPDPIRCDMTPVEQPMTGGTDMADGGV